MPVRHSIYLLLLTTFAACHSAVEKENGYDKEYTVGHIPDAESFQTLIPAEHHLDSTYKVRDQRIDSLIRYTDTSQADQSLRKRNFRSNRSRIQMDYRKAGDTLPAIESGIYFTPCDCVASNDTLLITMNTSNSIASRHLTIKVFKNHFRINYLDSAFNGSPYQEAENSTLTNAIVVNSKSQTLILDKTPAFKPGQQLLGYFSITSNNYWELSPGNKQQARFITARGYFTCHTSLESLLP
jgi:hypothetical protein